MNSARRVIAIAGLALAVLGGVGWAQDEEFARRQYESGLAFLRDQKFAEALKDFQSVVDAYPNSRVASAALLQIATYQLDTAGDVAAAQVAIDTIQKKYATSESAPMALVMAGRVVIAKGRTPAEVETALASYERVSRLFPGADAVPAAVYQAAEALRLVHREDEAALRYRQVSTDYPQSAWAPRALLGEARCLVITGKPLRAMELLQRVRQRFGATPEAVTAVSWNTILYRLYLRAPSQPPYAYSGRAIAGTAGKIKDIEMLAVDPHGTVLAATRSAIIPFDPLGKPLPLISANECRGVTFDRAGRPVVFHRGGVLMPGGASVLLAVPKPDGSLRAFDEIPAGVQTSLGDLLVADKNAKTIVRFAAGGRYLGSYATLLPARMVIDDTDRVIALDQDDSVAILEADGRLRVKIPARGQGYTFDRPLDVSVDAFGHVYVLDRGQVFVFTNQLQPRLLSSFSVPAKMPGNFRKAKCFGLDGAARLYIYDDDAEKIQVYQ
ncbi:MAG TPA: tetratricopeptide repeat protein [Vicinamibacterales bacterium]|jgi:TolA-binding protein